MTPTFFRGLSLFEITKTPSENQVPAFLDEAFYDPHQLTPDCVSRLNAWLTAYGKRLAREQVPCAKRKEQMNRVNPKYILRNYLAQTAIERAEKNDFSAIWELLDLIRAPYDEQPDREIFAAKRPEWARHKPGCSMLSCSS